MLISEKLAKAFSVQVGNEFGASLQYVMVASSFEREALPVLAARFYQQGDEERQHAMKIAHYVNAAGGQLCIPAIPAGNRANKPQNPLRHPHLRPPSTAATRPS